MLNLIGVYKNYKTNGNEICALQDVNISFREREFVSIIGPSGCGKTTLLNLIGGFDRCTSGEIYINGKSSSDFKEKDWDSYRNSLIGFVFQSYNLISHLTVFENVELTLKLSGVHKEERIVRTNNILKKLKLNNYANSKPDELSGGQAQRVAIARALVNDPKIIFADEPTGALDSELGEQTVSLLKEISKERLVVMVTHNDEFAKKFSTRIIKMKDGKILSDSDPYEPLSRERSSNTLAKSQMPVKTSKNRLRMTFKTAIGLSFKNLFSKKKRSILTSFAASIGILGIALVLAFSNGINLFIDNMQNTLLGSVPIGIYEYSVDYSVVFKALMALTDDNKNQGDYPDDGAVRFVDANNGSGIMGDMLETVIDSVTANNISDKFMDYLNSMDASLYESIHAYSGVQMNLLAMNKDGNVLDVSPSEVTTNVMNIFANVFGEKGLEKSRWNQLVGTNDFLGKHYDLMSGRWPEKKEDLVLVINERNELELPALENFGFDVDNADLNRDGKITFDELLSENSGFEIKLVSNNEFYEKTGDKLSSFPDICEYAPKTPSYEMYNAEENISLKIVGVLRIRSDSKLRVLGANLCYMPQLAQYATDNAKESDIVIEQKKLLEKSGYDNTYASAYTVLKGLPKVTDRYVSKNILGLLAASLNKTSFMKSFAIDTSPVYINIYPKNLEAKKQITFYIDAWNTDATGNIEYFDITEMVLYNVGILSNISIYALLIVASISLLVSSIMISIIISNSVAERSHEIGILRSIGGGKKDILLVFVAETLLIGIAGGAIGIALGYIFAPILSLLAKEIIGISNLAVINHYYSFALMGISVVLSFLAGLAPSYRASKKKIIDILRKE